jgi:hypothetical protein
MQTRKIRVERWTFAMDLNIQHNLSGVTAIQFTATSLEMIATQLKNISDLSNLFFPFPSDHNRATLTTSFHFEQ